ncbi:Ornithine carbamoyltransferase [hydrothermal vent metagenome]|uniref:ornithine carbamoyltransferase n=1 Tax=hydrothermal vent metagenome TaxID=652676 RepID=A0A3B1BPE4_9ZZZZ
MTQHFLTLLDLDQSNLKQLIQRAIELKTMHKTGEVYRPFSGLVLGMIFDKASTRTRVSFETAMAHFGGHAIFLSPRDTQLGRGEPVEDSARVLSSMVDAVMIRTFSHALVERFAENSRVPVINALTDHCHPCQLLADVQAYTEQRGHIAGRTVAWIGDGNNMCHSYINAAIRFDFTLNIATPPGYEPDASLVASAADRIHLSHSPQDAARGADLIATDVWASMGQEEEQKKREQDFTGYEVNRKLMGLANDDALFTHCLPAHRGEEVSAEVIDGPQSITWIAAENRLHSQKALLEYLLK